MTFGNYVDGAIRTHDKSGLRIRTDLSATLFFSVSLVGVYHNLLRMWAEP